MLEASRMMSILIHLLDNDGCMKTGIYRNICYTNRMPDKLDALEDEGLITQDAWDHAVHLHLTAKGRRVAGHLADIRDIMGTEPSEPQPAVICGRKGRSGISVFEASHMISALIFLLDHNCCRKTDLYEATYRSCMMPKKLVILQDAGMVTLIERPGMTAIHLTDMGREVAEHFAEVAGIMGTERPIRKVIPIRSESYP